MFSEQPGALWDTCVCCILHTSGAAADVMLCVYEVSIQVWCVCVCVCLVAGGAQGRCDVSIN